MTTDTDGNSWRKKLKILGIGGVVVVLSFALTAFLGYFLRASNLYTLHAGFEGMSVLTALGLVLLGVAQLLPASIQGQFQPRISRRQWPKARDLLAVMALALAVAVLVSHVAHGDDHLSPLVTATVFGREIVPGRTSAATALALLLLGCAVLFHQQGRRPRLNDTLGALALLIAGLALIGYAYGAQDFYSIPLFRTMGLNTSIAIFMLSMATLLMPEGNGWAAIFSRSGVAGETTRRQLLFLLFTPFVGFLLVKAAHAGHLRLGGAMTLLVITTIAPLFWLILRDGKILAQLEDERQFRQMAEVQYREILERRLHDQAAELALRNAEKLELAEAASQRSESRYRQLFESIDAGFCVIYVRLDEHDRCVDYQFVEVNAAFERQTGLKDAKGKWMRHLAQSHEQDWFDFYGRVAATQEAIRFESHAVMQDNRWYDVHAFPIDDPALRHVGILFNDITARRRAQIALEETNATLEERVTAIVAERELAQAALRQSQKMEAMGQLTGGVAHDFNNLLTPIIGSLDLIGRRGTANERERRLIEGALQSAERAKTLVQRLLAFARRQPLQLGPVDIGALVHNMGDLTASTLGAQFRVVVDIAKNLPCALADTNQMEMAILNLCVNARDAMPNGGTISICASSENLKEPKESLSPGRYIRLSVADTGMGMDTETARRAVEPFFSTKGIGKGTGLGLSMVHGLAAQLNGALEIHTAPGLGARIDLWLPISDISGAAVQATEIDGAFEKKHRGRVLLVDDEEAVRMTTADMLQELGYDVLERTTAREAEETLRAGQSVDLVVTDHMMPGVTGADLARTIRRHWPRLPVLLISGYADAEGVAADLPRLAKPFRQAELAQAIAEIA